MDKAMSTAKGEYKTMANGKSESPFPKSFQTMKPQSKMQGNQDLDNAVVKRPAFTPEGQK